MSKSAPEIRPDVFAFRDARVCARALIEHKQRSEEHFSFRKLARLADLGSPGYIQTYLAGGRNLKPETARRFGQALGLEADAVEYFVVLTAFTQAVDEDERAAWYEQVLRRAVRHGSGRVDAARLSYFTEWYVPVVHAMASLAGFRADPAWIAPRLVPAIRPAEAGKALRVLADVGILAPGPDGTVTVREPVLETDGNLGGIWMREYHRAMIRLSERALDLLPPEDRNITGFTVTVPGERLPEVLAWGEEALRALFYRVLALQADTPAAVGEVVQFNLQGFRLTRATEGGS